MICGTLNPTSGSIQTQGRIAALLELGSGFNSEFTGRENVYLNGAVLGLSKDEIDARFDDITAFADIGDFIEQPVKTYSSGMHARLAFSIAINVEPEILIVDEALAVGDARFVAKCMQRIKDIQENGASILFVSHDVGSVRTLCERAIWLNKGCLAEQGDVFPVTGRFMEYMFRDEPNEQEALSEELAANSQSSSFMKDDVLKEKPSAMICSVTANSPQSYQNLDRSFPALDKRPVTHWGSHKGMILSAAIHDELGSVCDVFTWGQRITVLIEVLIPESISREHLSVAFSIKDLKGTDLIVSTTHDFECKSLPDERRFSVIFQLTNFLVTGKYLLVAAVENRQHHGIHYYEYIEGAQYFGSLSKERFFGIFQPPISQQVLV
jgi:lipopolysaccharide transport system ATP-binding protein